MTHSPTTQGKPRAGFTLIEALMAIALSAVIGLAVAMMMRTLSQTTLAHDAARARTLVRASAQARIGAALRPGAHILAVSEDRLVVWCGDAIRNAVVDLSELVLIVYDHDRAALLAFRYPPTESPADAHTLDIDEVFNAVLDNMLSLPTPPNAEDGFTIPGLPDAVLIESVVMPGISSIAWRLDDPDPILAKRICIDADIVHDDATQHITMVVALRVNDAAPE